MNTIMYFRGLPALVGSFILIMASQAWSQSQFQWENFAGMPGGSKARVVVVGGGHAGVWLL